MPWRHRQLLPEAADAVTLYTAATHAQTAWEHATPSDAQIADQAVRQDPRPGGRPGASANALPTTNISPAALARSISTEDLPTLILDEADTIWGKKDQRAEGAEDLRGILNAGHSRGGPTCGGTPAPASASCARRSPWPSSAACPTPSRTAPVVISMRRRAPESVTQWRSRRAVPRLQELRERLREWVTARAPFATQSATHFDLDS